MTITKFKIQTIHINLIETKKLEINYNCKSLFQLHEFKNKIHCLVATNTVSLILNPFFTEIIYTKKLISPPHSGESVNIFKYTNQPQKWSKTSRAFAT